MRSAIVLGLALGATVVGGAASAQESASTRPDVLLRQVVPGMPRGERQEVRVFAASFQPGERTVVHTHRFPVTVYVVEGEFTLEVSGRPPVTVTAGQALTEPTRVKMAGYNRGAGVLRVVVFQVSDPDVPFLDLFD